MKNFPFTFIPNKKNPHKIDAITPQDENGNLTFVDKNGAAVLVLDFMKSAIDKVKHLNVLEKLYSKNAYFVNVETDKLKIANEDLSTKLAGISKTVADLNASIGNLSKSIGNVENDVRGVKGFIKGSHAYHHQEGVTRVHHQDGYIKPEGLWVAGLNHDIGLGFGRYVIVFTINELGVAGRTGMGCDFVVQRQTDGSSNWVDIKSINYVPNMESDPNYCNAVVDDGVKTTGVRYRILLRRNKECSGFIYNGATITLFRI